MPASQGTAIGSPLINIAVFGAFVLVTLVIVFQAARSNRTTADYYTGNHQITGTQNGIALAGDYLSAASFLGIAGAVAVYGYDGASYAFGNIIGWVIALLLIAEASRNTGRFTMGDILGFRSPKRRVRVAAAGSTLTISILYMIAQVAGAGALIALLLGIPNTDRLSQGAAIAAVGILMILYVLIGGMKGTTWVQIIKAGLLMVVAVVLSAWVLGRFGYNFSAVLGAAVQASPAGERLLAPGVTYAGNPLAGIDQFSSAFAGLAGPASLPHILMRFNTVANGREVRRSVVWAIWLVGTFFIMIIVIGFGAGALLGPETIMAAPGATNAAIPLLAYRIGGELLLGLVAAVAFATILAVVAGLTITASASFAHDIYAGVLRRGRVDQRQEIRVARGAAVVVGLLAIGGGIVANGLNTAFLVTLVFGIAASANLPALVFSIFWKRFNSTGLLLSMWGGLITATTLVVFSPAVSGRPTAMFPEADFDWFPLQNPGLVSVPLAFLLAVLGTFLGERAPDADRRFAEMEVRAITGARAVDPPRTGAHRAVARGGSEPVGFEPVERPPWTADHDTDPHGGRVSGRRGAPPPAPRSPPRGHDRR
ncbi:solute symporter family protein [Pseudonocardia lacus]|uniref:solute symporter family protein n=1 Tax=Pseudonocardia lacus TaxID=2835865 RepID=UPI001BDCF5EE|nr:cation acetate symporter [Pseudonocardia lacus]